MVEINDLNWNIFTPLYFRINLAMEYRLTMYALTISDQIFVIRRPSDISWTRVTPCADLWSCPAPWPRHCHQPSLSLRSAVSQYRNLSVHTYSYYTFCNDAIVHSKHGAVANISANYLMFPERFFMYGAHWSLFLGTLPVMLAKTL